MEELVFCCHGPTLHDFRLFDRSVGDLSCHGEVKKERFMMNNTTIVQQPMRILGIFAHPDDESFCAGGTLASYVASGAKVMVVSATQGEAGQIRSVGAATRRTLGRVREEEFQRACQRLGVQHAVCLNYSDGMLQEVDQKVLIREIVEIIRTFRPDVVITFGHDGGYGHPDHIAISTATTMACAQSGEYNQFPEQLVAGLLPHRPAQLYHSHFPQQHQLLFEQLAHWLVQRKTRFRGTPEFAYMLSLLCEEATLLRYSSDHFDVNWYPKGFSIIEQREHSHSLYLILSGTADAIREDLDGTQHVLTRLEAGAFFGEEGVAYQKPYNAHVVAVENVTCLVFSPKAPTAFQGRGEDAHLTGCARNFEQDEEYSVRVTTCFDVRSYCQQKIEAIAAHHSQFPIVSDLLPLAIFQELMGREYFVSIPLFSEVEPGLRASQAA
jgi:LmbE family N-acetylglucosaminyl deacetylase